MRHKGIQTLAELHLILMRRICAFIEIGRNRIVLDVKLRADGGTFAEGLRGSRPAFRKGEYHAVSLLQLAVHERVYLFRLNKCGFPAPLKRLLANCEILKIGVGIRDDIKALQRLGGFVPAAFLDLQTFVEQYGIEEKSFSKLMAIIFHVRISKRQRTSNWELPKLTDQQIRYASTDAWGALRMYNELKRD